MFVELVDGFNRVVPVFAGEHLLPDGGVVLVDLAVQVVVLPLLEVLVEQAVAVVVDAVRLPCCRLPLRTPSYDS